MKTTNRKKKKLILFAFQHLPAICQDESSVQQLIEACITDEDKLYLCVSSPTIKDKPVQIRPWRLSDADFVLDASMPLDPRKTVFVGGVPRPLKAGNYNTTMAMAMWYRKTQRHMVNNIFYFINNSWAGYDHGSLVRWRMLCWHRYRSGAEISKGLYYLLIKPHIFQFHTSSSILIVLSFEWQGAGRVAFSNQQSYIAAISARFVQLQHGDIDKRVEVKPYVLDDQMCDECQGSRCGGKFAPFFCANVTCLQVKFHFQLNYLSLGYVQSINWVKANASCWSLTSVI